MKKRKIIHSALSLSLTAALCLSMAACGGTQTPADSVAASQPSAPSAVVQPSAAETTSAALPVKALNPKQVEENPYMAKSDANIHHDGYNTDSTDEILPLAIYPEINVSYETTNANASPAIYFDSYGHAVVPLLGGIAIRDLNAEETKTLGYFSPKKHDGGGYVIQSSYTFLDASNRIVCPTSNNHVLMLRATDESGNVLPEFEKVLDIDIKAAAEAALGKELTQNLLSVVFDYDGNLWFATGGFRIYPQRQQQGVIGYIARSAIDAILNREQTDLSKAVFVYELTPGEGAENGIAASKDGAVILTNQNCYLLRAEEGVDVVWCTPYESAGAKVSGEGDKTTGGGLAWGGGCSPTLTPNLVLFTDNQDIVNLLALDMKTGEVVASARRICEVLNEKADLTSPTQALTAVPDGSVDFDHVSFSYRQGKGKPVLQDIDLHIEAGQTIGILGGTGSAKSSLVNLISRLYDVSEGSVRVGGHDVREYDLTTLRDEVAVVLQKNVLFSGTILENLRWGNAEATQEECERVCRLACADDFIQAMPQGYETYIEQGGTNVSGA